MPLTDIEGPPVGRFAGNVLKRFLLIIITHRRDKGRVVVLPCTSNEIITTVYTLSLIYSCKDGFIKIEIIYLYVTH